MKHPSQATLPASLLALALMSSTAFAQPGKQDAGKQEFDTNCAVCHASDGKGNGPFVPYLRTTPPDLTTLAKRNGGVLPVNRMLETIEGGNVPSHSARDMPIWGNAYRVQAGEYYVDVPYDPAVYVRSRILTLVDYINRLQAR
jgi:mono/diheme cytochrome c family protein